ncbi:uncharacterized protein LOC129583293 [Paramacrobiotus metropolitanus]|uniref:uncharacterized protein LOC129583293 n=1 Tax=Paramacrobiotus metropolitanus TaxID=2943436 RepID=UPI0024459FB2|nr:uncharacterized protein LOC129583293 [Paramacrobiotus metropolitanus]
MARLLFFIGIFFAATALASAGDKDKAKPSKPSSDDDKPAQQRGLLGSAIGGMVSLGGQVIGTAGQVIGAGVQHIGQHVDNVVGGVAALAEVALGKKPQYDALPDNFESLTAAKKLDLVWNNVQKGVYSMNSLPQMDPSSTLQLPKVFDPEYLKHAFLHHGEEMLPGRQKLIHSFGSVAKVELVITPEASLKYSGIFQSGGNGIARLSLAAPANDLPGFDYTPGMALKFYRDGQESANIIAMFSVDGQGKDFNFFAKNFSNFIPNGKSAFQLQLGPKFEAAIPLLEAGPKGCARPEDATKLPQYEQAAFDSRGGAPAINTVRAPYTLKFVPNPKMAWPGSDHTDLRKQLAKIPENSTLYTIVSIPEKGGNEETLGSIVTKSKFVPSHYADTKMYFRHHSQSCFIAPSSA